MSLTDLQGMTENQLKALTAAQLVDHIMQERGYTLVTVQEGDSRGMTRHVVEERDYKGKLISTTETLTTYNPKGEVDVITKIEKDGAGKQTRKLEIAHDGIRAWIKSDEKAKVIAPQKAASPVAVAAAKTSGLLQTVKAKLAGLVKRS